MSIKQNEKIKNLKRKLDEMVAKPSLAFAIPTLVPLAAVGLMMGATYLSGTPDGTIVHVVPTKAIFGGGCSHC
jgi:hypothetical protein